jgi:hypothetical protein
MVAIEVEMEQVHERKEVPDMERIRGWVNTGIRSYGIRFDQVFKVPGGAGGCLLELSRGK